MQQWSQKMCVFLCVNTIPMNKYKFGVTFRLEQRKDKETGEIPTDNLPINADITFLNYRFKYYTGHRINASKWEVGERAGEKYQLVKKGNFNAQGESAADINKKLEEIKTALEKIFDGLKYKGINPTVNLVRAELKQILNDKEESKGNISIWPYFDRYVKDAKIATSTKTLFYSLKNRLLLFEQSLGYQITFDKSTHELIRKFEDFIKIEGTDPDQYNYMKIHLRPRPKSKNTIVGILRRLSRFYKEMKDAGMIKENPFDNYPIGSEVYGHPIYLTKAERDHLASIPINNARLQRTRDLFILQCLIGCRVGDYVKLKKANIINNSIEYIPRKTKDDNPVVVRVPLSSKAKEIISRYDMPDGSLMPFIVKSKYDEYLKEVFRLAELDRIVTRLNPLTRQEEQVTLSSLASSHMARRTFVGTLHSKVKDSVISSMTGHSKNSRAFSRYYDIDEETKTDAINNFLE